MIIYPVIDESDLSLKYSQDIDFWEFWNPIFWQSIVFSDKKVYFII